MEPYLFNRLFAIFTECDKRCTDINPLRCIKPLWPEHDPHYLRTTENSYWNDLLSFGQTGYDGTQVYRVREARGP